MQCWPLWPKELISIQLKNYHHSILNELFKKGDKFLLNPAILLWVAWYSVFKNNAVTLLLAESIQCLISLSIVTLNLLYYYSILWFQFFNHFIHCNCKLTLYFQNIAPQSVQKLTINNQCHLPLNFFAVGKLMSIKSCLPFVVKCLFSVFDTFAFLVLPRSQAYHDMIVFISLVVFLILALNGCPKSSCHYLNSLYVHHF